MQMNPWRKGRVAARGWFEEVAAWRARKVFSAPRPEQPKNPYPLGRSRNSGSYQWESGFRSQVQQCEMEQRRARSKERK